MINLLYIVGVWGNGGIEKVVYTYCKNLSPDKYNIYLLPIEKRESIFTAKLQEIGVTIIEPVEKINGNALQKYKSRKKIVCNAVKNKHFDIVHFHNSIFTSYMFLNEMKKICPNTKYILHSHGDNAEAPYVHIKRLLNNIIKTIYQNVPDFCTACSDNAGKWSFTKRIYLSNKYTTLFNAFNTEDYMFDINKREYLKKYHKIESRFVIGTIGRFCYQKNPEFIIQIIKNMNEKKYDFTFVWIGDGPDKDKMKNLAASYKINNIIYISSTDDIRGYLSLMDAFILPSRYEGLGLVLIEALSCGLQCFASNVIPKDTQINSKIQYLPISESDSYIWSDKIIRFLQRTNTLKNNLVDRSYPKKELHKSGFDIEPLMIKLNNIYKELMEKK